MSDHILIYLIVLLNALCQIMLIWRLKHIGRSKSVFLFCAVLIPIVAALSMRLLVAKGIIHGHLNEQSRLEHLVTQAMSMLLISGPWLVTISAILSNKNGKALVRQL